MNVEIGVAAATATASSTATAIKTVVRILAPVLPSWELFAVTPILTFLRSGNSSLSAVPGDLDFITRGGETVLV